jgi:signal transduction protein with GAF and PtsI domain
MDVHGRLVRVAADATSPAEALTTAARVIAEELQADACSILARKGTRGPLVPVLISVRSSYTLVVDRDDPRLASERHSYHPAILRMIQRVVTRAHDAGKFVTVCGEMAAKPELALTLLAMEIDALSVSPREIPQLKRALAHVPLEPFQAKIDDILALSTEDDVIANLRRTIDPHVRASCA